ncbi:MAG TPA: hypothetical protein VD994_01175 [Prosthecobacter sp.]|nr:hypothetical protein [Prosthecobacter sp.]
MNAVDKSALREPLKKRVGGSLAKLDPLQRLEMLRLPISAATPFAMRKATMIRLKLSSLVKRIGWTSLLTKLQQVPQAFD